MMAMASDEIVMGDHSQLEADRSAAIDPDS